MGGLDAAPALGSNSNAKDVPLGTPFATRKGAMLRMRGRKQEPTFEGSMSTDEKRVRLAAVADLHCTKTSRGAFESLFRHVREVADVLVLCGDLTDHGLPEE